MQSAQTCTPIVIFELNPCLPILTLCLIQDTHGSIRGRIIVVCPKKTPPMNLYGMAKSMRLNLNERYLNDSLRMGEIIEACPE